MKKYAELNLKKIREDNGLDFAHFTYVKGMCSCCYGPTDLPAIYWKDGIVKNEEDKYSYILFKNANNGSGQVKRKDEITNYTCISHGNLSANNSLFLFKESFIFIFSSSTSSK